ncbi:MAG: glycosyltransferase family 4 protein [Geminicoccaceae bacterium]
MRQQVQPNLLEGEHRGAVRSHHEAVHPGTAESRISADDLVGGETGLRVCLISETLITGVGRHVVDLAQALIGRGHHVLLIHSSLRFEQRLVDELDRLPGLVRKSLPAKIGPHWTDLKVLREVLALIRRHGPFDVIHGHSSKGGLYARLSGLFVRRPVLYSPHSFVTSKPDLSLANRILYRSVEKGLAWMTSCIVCTSEAELAHARHLGIREARLDTIHNGLSDDTFEQPKVDVRRRLGLSEETVVVGFVGRMDQQKAPQRLVDAAIHLLRCRKDFHFVMLGDGPFRSNLEQKLTDLDLREYFSWCGYQNARQWIPDFDILAMPSQYEGFSYVLLETLKAGVPVICTPVAGVSDAVQDGVEGFVVPHDDDQALARRLMDLGNDPEQRRRMGERGRGSAARFTVDRMIEKLEKLYRSLSASRSPVSATESG